jgi:N-acetylhexosamine 1-kinase
MMGAMNGTGPRTVPAAVIDGFRFEGTPVATQWLAGGHIHRNVLVTCPGGRYVLQKLNDRVFPDLGGLLSNVERLVAHLEAKGRVAPELVETHTGAWSLRIDDGTTWRAFRYLEGTVGRDAPSGPVDATEAARAFADYAGAVADLPGPPLAVTIERFHDLPHRLAALDAAARSDPVGRRVGLASELSRSRRLGLEVAEALGAGDGEAIVRIVHNDAKLSNVRFDAETGQATCVVDLDTTMTGRVRYDVGELVRTATTHAPEDAADESRVDFDLELLDAVAIGYLTGHPRLQPSEVGSLGLAGAEMAIENALRFLTDHLLGDTYFAVDRAGQNLDRCRTHLRLTELMLASQAESDACFARAARNACPPDPPAAETRGRIR